MKHPLEFIPAAYRKTLFFIFLFLTITLFAVFGILDKPLRTHNLNSNGIVSFELAFNPIQAFEILRSWSGSQTHILPPLAGAYESSPQFMYAAFGLGLDYLFMPTYAFVLAFGTLLAAGRHSGWLKSLGAVAGYGAFAAALFDAVENFALFQVLLGAYQSAYPAIAAICATIKFVLLILGLVYALAAWLLPRQS
ncbi:MAG: hypothetical protein QM730_17760 [Anaerolineales bacterium]